jgi:G3E family GTPase
MEDQIKGHYMVHVSNGHVRPFFILLADAYTEKCIGLCSSVYKFGNVKYTVFQKAQVAVANVLLLSKIDLIIPHTLENQFCNA